MPPPSPATERLIETLPLKERIRQRANKLYIERVERSAVAAWHQAEEEIIRAHQDALVEEASEESFPASDSPAY